jgi:hypothetical protein
MGWRDERYLNAKDFGDQLIDAIKNQKKLNFKSKLEIPIEIHGREIVAWDPMDD